MEQRQKCLFSLNSIWNAVCRPSLRLRIRSSSVHVIGNQQRAYLAVLRQTDNGCVHRVHFVDYVVGSADTVINSVQRGDRGVDEKPALEVSIRLSIGWLVGAV